MAKKATRGREALPTHVKSRRLTVKVYKELEEAREVLARDIGFKEYKPDSKHGKELQKVLDDRNVVNEEIEILIEKINALVWKEELNAREETLLEDLKERRTEAYARLSELPELGLTYAEWEDYPEEFKQKTLGRPKVGADRMVVRLQRSLEEAIKSQRADEKKAGEKHLTPKQLMRKKDSEADGGTGRPAMTDLDKLDREVNRLTNLRLGALEEAETWDPNAVAGRGRPKKPPMQRAKEIMAKIRHLKELISVKEDELDNLGRIERRLKQLRKKLRVETAKVEAQGQSADSNAAVNRLSNKATALQRYRDYIKRRMKGEPTTIPYKLTEIQVDKMYAEFIRNDPDGALYHGDIEDLVSSQSARGEMDQVSESLKRG